jgi:hypothetical protein
MNDVTILTPLPQSPSTPVLLFGTDLADDGTAFVPRALLDRVVKNDLTLPDLHASLHLTAVRFDLCDRHLPGACPPSEDARLRLVFQPFPMAARTRDLGFHAFYAIRNDEIAGAVTALRDLARSVPAQTGALRVSPALSAANPQPYAAALRAFVKRYGGDTRLVRLTVNLVPESTAAIRWTLRGVEKSGDVFVDIPIAGTTQTTQSVILSGMLPRPSYDVVPIIDKPTGLLGAITLTTFEAADAVTKSAYLAALAAVDNPLSQTAETVPCVACHVSTVILNARAANASIDPLALPGRYTSKFDLSIAGGEAAQTPSTIRALGYFGEKPMISQRVVNETAQTLTEIESRFPPP